MTNKKLTFLAANEGDRKREKTNSEKRAMGGSFENPISFLKQKWLRNVKMVGCSSLPQSPLYRRKYSDYHFMQNNLIGSFRYSLNGEYERYYSWFSNYDFIEVRNIIHKKQSMRFNFIVVNLIIIF